MGFEMTILISNILAETGNGTESFSELASRDPEKFTDQDDDLIIVELRKMRERWETGEKTKKVTGKRLVTGTAEEIDGL